MGMAILRRFLNFIPQKFHMDVGAAHVANLRQNWNPFVVKVSVDFSPDTQKLLDKRFGIAVAILHSAVEGRQS